MTIKKSIATIRRNRLKQWIDEHCGSAQSVFIEKTNINQGELSALLRDKSFGEKKARKLEQLAGMPHLWLDNIEEPHHALKNEIDPYLDHFPVRIGRFSLTAGITGFSIEYIEEEFNDSLFFKKDWINSKGYNPDKLVACKIKGESMEPSLYQDDVVIINIADNIPQDGKVFAINYEGELVIKRLYRDAGVWYMSSDNPDKIRFPNKKCASDICIPIGRVVHKQSERV